MNKYQDYPVAESSSGIGGIRMDTIRERMVRNKKDLEDRLAEINSAIRLLDENPKLEQFTDTLRRIGI